MNLKESGCSCWSTTKWHWYVTVNAPLFVPQHHTASKLLERAVQQKRGLMSRGQGSFMDVETKEGRDVISYGHPPSLLPTMTMDITTSNVYCVKNILNKHYLASDDGKGCSWSEVPILTDELRLSCSWSYQKVGMAPLSLWQKLNKIIATKCVSLLDIAHQILPCCS